MSELAHHAWMRALLLGCLAGGVVEADPARGGLLDPTRPAGWQAPGETVASDPGQAASALRLQGTFSVGGARSAMISGRRVTVGDEVSGAEVLAIDRDRVILRIDGEQVELASVLPGVKAPAREQGDVK